MKKHDCYKCIHREKIPGDAHSKCNAEVKKGDINLTIKINIKCDTFHWISKRQG